MFRFRELLPPGPERAIPGLTYFPDSSLVVIHLPPSPPLYSNSKPSSLTSILASNTIVLVVEFKHSLTDTALLTGYHLCGIGVAGIITVATARVWGKRHLYVFGTVLLIISSFWAGAAKDYKSLLWARILQGVAVCPFEALVNASVGDLYCVHQRGKRMALTNFSLFGGAFITPVVVGKMTSTIGWRWSFYFVGIFSGLLLPLVCICLGGGGGSRDS